MNKKNEFSKYSDLELPSLMRGAPPYEQDSIMAEIIRRGSATSNRLAIFSLAIASISLIVSLIRLFSQG